jgi:hypothetical protein
VRLTAESLQNLIKILPPKGGKLLDARSRLRREIIQKLTKKIIRKLG